MPLIIHQVRTTKRIGKHELFGLEHLISVEMNDPCDYRTLVLSTSFHASNSMDVVCSHLDPTATATNENLHAHIKTVNPCQMYTLYVHMLSHNNVTL